LKINSLNLNKLEEPCFNEFISETGVF